MIQGRCGEKGRDVDGGGWGQVGDEDGKGREGKGGIV